MSPAPFLLKGSTGSGMEDSSCVRKLTSGPGVGRAGQGRKEGRGGWYASVFSDTLSVLDTTAVKVEAGQGNGICYPNNHQSNFKKICSLHMPPSHSLFYVINS